MSKPIHKMRDCRFSREIEWCGNQVGFERGVAKETVEYHLRNCLSQMLLRENKERAVGLCVWIR
jgi:hypothetical protein